MDKKTEIKVMEALYDRLFQAVTYAPSGQDSLFDKKTTFIQFAKNAALNPKDFSNQLSPVNPNGNLNSAEYFSRMVDIVPALSAEYVASSNKLSGTYSNIANGANTKEQVSKEQKEIYEKASQFLQKKVTIEDFQGNKTTSLQPTAIFKAYQANQKAYLNALAAYRLAYLSYNLDNIDDQRKWQANEPLLRNAIDQAYQNWRSQGAVQVEQALAAMASSMNNIVSSVIENAQTNLKNGQMSGSPGQSDWFMTYPNPSNWSDDSALPNFSKLTLSSNNLTKTSDSRFTDYGGGGGANWGLWSVSTSVDGHHKESNSNMQADKFDLSAKIAVVQINRPWLNDLIFKMKGWSLLGQKSGDVSNGQLKGNADSMLPLIPTAFIVARDISITANWSTEDKKHVENSISVKASVGWGPFSVNGNYSHGSSSDYFNSTFNGGTLNIPGMQIIGWVNEIVPFAAPLNG